MKPVKFTFLVLAIPAILGITACCTTEKVENGNVEPPRHLEIEQINQGVLTGNGEEPVGFEIGYVIQSEKEWQALRKKMNAVNFAQGAITIDFEASTVLAYFDKVRPNGGYSVEVTQVIESDQDIKVMYASSAPSGIATTVMTQPFHIVKVSKTNKTAKFLAVTE